MKIQIIGTGCPKCRALHANAERAVTELGLDATIEKVDDIRDIARMGVMMTPALAIDGVVRSQGHLLSAHQIERMLA